MSNFRPKDIENVIKASQTANLLFSDLRDIVSSENMLLSDMAVEMIEVVSKVEKKLERLAIFLQEENLSMPNQSLDETSYAEKREESPNP
jgi:hypothetical protein